MKVCINPQLFTPSPPPLPPGWRYIRQPAARPALALSIMAGLALPLIPFVLLTFQSWLRRGLEEGSSNESIPMWIVLPVFLVSVVLHEGLHLLAHPGGGLSPRSLLLIWPRRLSLGVYYDGFMTRARWLLMRLAPLTGLVVLPTLVLMIFPSGEMSFFWRQFVVLVVFVNCLGAGGDLVAALIVARQVPASGQVGNWQGRACWFR